MTTDRAPKEAKDQKKRRQEAQTPEDAFQIEAAAPLRPDHANILHLQRTIGNQAVQRLVAQGRLTSQGTHIQAKPSVTDEKADQEQDVDESAETVMRLGTDMIGRTPATDLIDQHTSWGNLHEDALGQELLTKARQGNFSFVYEVLDTLGSTDRDDVSYEMMTATDADTLLGFAHSEGGRRMLDRLFEELTAGSVAEEEQKQADRIISAKGQNAPIGQFPQAPSAGKIFPFRLPGLTVLNDAPLTAERRDDGKIWVSMPVRVLGTDKFQEETRTLPPEVFTSGIELPENEIVGVKMYDLGGEILYRPSLFLIQLSNQTDTTILEKIGEAAGLGLTLGSGALAGVGVEASMTARVLMWMDRIAFGLGTITSIIREHRGWIIERFGDNGKQFLHYVDLVNSAVAIYGGLRVVFGMGQLVMGFRTSFNAWRDAVRAAETELGTTERNIIQQVNQQGEAFIQDAENIRNAGKPGVGTGTGEPANPITPSAPEAAPTGSTPKPEALPETGPGASKQPQTPGTASPDTPSPPTSEAAPTSDTAKPEAPAASSPETAPAKPGEKPVQPGEVSVSPEGVPQLQPAEGRKMLGEALKHLKQTPPAERASLFRQLKAQIEQHTKGSWAAAESPGVDGSTIFAGEFGEALVFDPNGNMFRGRIGNPGQFEFVGPGGELQPVYPKLTPIK